MTKGRKRRGMEAVLDLARESARTARRNARAPGWTGATLATLIVSVGAVTGVVSLAWESLVRPLPFDRPGELVEVTARPVDGRGGAPRFSLSLLEAWQADRPAGVPVGGFASTQTPVELGGGQQYVDAGIVTGGLMGLLGVEPILGRTFEAADGLEGAPRVVILTETLWRTRFGADPGIVGRALESGSERMTVVGVVRDELNALVPNATLWMSTAAFPRAPYFTVFRAVGRLPQGVIAEMASERLAGARVAEVDGRAFSGVARPLRESLVGDLRRVLLVFVGVVSGLMLIATVNLANLFLGRAAAGAGDRRTRRALGASRGRLASAAVLDGCVLGLLGGIGGLVAGMGIRRLVLLWSPAAIPLTGIGRAGAVEAAVALGIALVTCSGLAAWSSASATSRFGATQGGASRGGSDGRSLRRLQRGLLVVQVTATFVLVTGSALLLRTFAHLNGLEPGFDTAEVGTVELSLPWSRYADAAAQEAFQRELVAEIAAIPGIAAVVAIDRALVRTRVHARIEVEGRDSLAVPRTAVVAEAQPGLLDVMGIPLVRGRGLDPAAPRDGEIEAVVSESFARTFLPDGDPIGRRYQRGEGRWRTIVGIAADVLTAGPAHAPEPYTIESLEQTGTWTNFATLVFRTHGDAAGALPAVLARLQAVEPEAPVIASGTYERWLHESAGFAEARFRALVVGMLGLVASVLAIVGVFGVTAYGVRRRMRELGIRLAVGGSAPTIAVSVLGESLKLSLWGVLLGAALAWPAVGALESLLLGLPARDPAVFLAVGGALVSATLAASLRPALSAGRVAPARVLADVG